jgi:translation initiation factor 1
MGDIFDAAGLPDELQDFDALDEIAKEQTELRITTDSRRYGKLMTIVSGLDDSSLEPKKLLSQLKSKCACGGAFKDGHIELQGDHVRKVSQTLEQMGFLVRAD